MRNISLFLSTFCLIASLLLIGYAPEIRDVADRLEGKTLSMQVR